MGNVTNHLLNDLYCFVEVINRLRKKTGDITSLFFCGAVHGGASNVSQGLGGAGNPSPSPKSPMRASIPVNGAISILDGVVRE